MGEVQKEVGGGPELRRGRGDELLEGFGHGPVEGGDCGLQEGEGFQLAYCGQETSGGPWGAALYNHTVEGVG